MINELLKLLIVLILMGFIAFVIVVFNNVRFLINNIKKAESNLKVLLKQRFDEVTNLISICKGYIKHETEVFVKISNLRNDFYKKTDIYNNTEKNFEPLMDLNDDLSEQMSILSNIFENYPDLKSVEHFKYLQKRISEIENQIAIRRSFLNESVNVYNIRIESFPEIIIAKIFRYRKENYFD
jgi:LemA protein